MPLRKVGLCGLAWGKKMKSCLLDNEMLPTYSSVRLVKTSELNSVRQFSSISRTNEMHRLQRNNLGRSGVRNDLKEKTQKESRGLLVLPYLPVQRKLTTRTSRRRCSILRAQQFALLLGISFRETVSGIHHCSMGCTRREETRQGSGNIYE